MLELFRLRNLIAVGAILLATSGAYGALHTTQGVHSVATGESPLDPGAFRAPREASPAPSRAPGPTGGPRTATRRTSS